VQAVRRSRAEVAAEGDRFIASTCQVQAQETEKERKQLKWRLGCSCGNRAAAGFELTVRTYMVSFPSLPTYDA
jgi:hypothetical protein